MEHINNLLDHGRKFGPYSRDIITLATVFGLICLTYKFISSIYKLIWSIKVYIISQKCVLFRRNLKEKYGKWALITGSSDGIGLALAHQLAKHGMSLVIMGRDEQKLAAAKESLEREKCVGDIITIRKDFSDSSQESYEELERIIDPDNRDIGLLINNVGVYPLDLKNFDKRDLNEVRNELTINAFSTTLMTRMILPGMLKRNRGMVMNVISIAAYTPLPYMNVYSPTKAYVLQLTRQLQMEYSSSPIDIIALAPGPVYVKKIQEYSKRSMLILLPDDYAKSVVNAISTCCLPNEFTGCFAHEICKTHPIGAISTL